MLVRSVVVAAVVVLVVVGVVVVVVVVVGYGLCPGAGVSLLWLQSAAGFLGAPVRILGI